jgi:hypothetical protein
MPDSQPRRLLGVSPSEIGVFFRRKFHEARASEANLTEIEWHMAEH